MFTKHQKIKFLTIILKNCKIEHSEVKNNLEKLELGNSARRFKCWRNSDDACIEVPFPLAMHETTR
jgi:hypothetical protein